MLKKALFLLWVVLASSKAFSQTVTIDEAIDTCSHELGQRLDKGSSVAVLNFVSNWSQLSSYVIEEMNNAIVRKNAITVVDRRQLDLLRQEQNFQMSGEVSDESAQQIGHLLGAETIVSGSLETIGSTYRFRIRAISVETGTMQYSNSLNIIKDDILSALMPKPSIKYEYTTRDYNFGERIGIGLLYSFFGVGAIAFDDDDNWRILFPAGIIGGPLIVGLLAWGSAGSVGDWEAAKAGLIGAAIPFGICAVIGFVRAFFLHTEKSTRVRVSSAAVIDVNLVPVLSNNIGIQVSYRWQLQ